MITRVQTLLSDLSVAERGSIVNLTPSENRLSPRAAALLGSDLANRYHFGADLNGTDEFPAGARAARLVEAGRAALAELGRCQFVNTRPVSGMSAMHLVLYAMARRGSGTILYVEETSGGHYATGEIVKMFGGVPVPIGYDEYGVFDIRSALSRVDPRSVVGVYLDVQNTVVEPRYSQAVEELREGGVDAWVHVDCSHTLGLILGGAHSRPTVDGPLSFGGSTHKTFPGPHKGCIMTSDDAVSKDLDGAQPYILSSHHLAAEASLALSALEFQFYGAEYASRVLESSRALADALTVRGVAVESVSPGCVGSHQVWVGPDARCTNTWFEVADILASTGIFLNVQRSLPRVGGPSLRLGTAEMALLGATAESMSIVADMIASVSRGELGAAGPDSAERLRGSFGAPLWDGVPVG
ncbi:hypothetical protein [Nocardia sp. bgisy134]|uniref:hypothetical protein n=1 Tax=Nocardia sp. bgisy134 TaxID=3413789 RepID=UPI003D75056A